MSTSEPTRHAGTVAIVTGAASGIGRATAVRLAAEGARVLACDVDEDGLHALATQMSDEGCKVRTIRADITSQTAVDMVLDEAQRWGPVTGLANVAGIMDGFLPAHELDDATWTRVIAVNLEAAFRLARAVLPGMRARAHGTIVNVGSIAGLRGGAAGLAYTTSKHALVGLTRSIAWSYAEEGIRCNIVMPGYVKTGIKAEQPSQWGLQRGAPILAQSVRRADADEVAGIVAWLLSPESRGVNGAVLAADSGWTAG